MIDVDATVVVAHSEKEQASPTYKRTFGFHPIGVWCDNTGELLAVQLRRGAAAANDAGDHIDILGEAIDQIPAKNRLDSESNLFQIRPCVGCMSVDNLSMGQRQEREG